MDKGEGTEKGGGSVDNPLAGFGVPGFRTPTLGDFALGLSFFTLLNLNFLTFCIKKDNRKADRCSKALENGY